MNCIYSRMLESIQHRLAATGIPQDKAISASISAVESALAECGGRQVYLPRRLPWPDRDLAIRNQFDGRNVEDLCRKFRVSRATVYRVVEK